MLYGGYQEEADRFYWKELTFHHYAGECGLPGAFPGRTSRQRMALMRGMEMNVHAGRARGGPRRGSDIIP